ncbi:hypothetical protein I4F81_012333 [Pyropia yezoensis]|nr:hypothetical protein I4F81_012333 [Neopyropia yezoensis]
MGLPLTRVDATPFSEVDLHRPPLPVVDIPAGDSVAAGQVGCTHTHVRIWRAALAANHSRVVVLEDDVFFTPQVVTAYNVPLDVQISRLHQPGTGFTSLVACNALASGDACDEAVYELSREEKGECSYSASQSGSREDGGAFPHSGGRRAVAPL